MTFKNEQPWYRSIASLFGLTMFCMVASKGFNQAAYSNLLFLLVWLGPNLLIAFWIKNIFLRLRNGVYAPVDSPYGNALYLVVGLSLTLIVVIGVNLYMFSWLRSETLLFFVGLHLISFLFFSITYVRSKELKLSHVLWGAIHTWVLPSILIYGLLFTLKIWPVSVDSVLFGVWAFVSGYRSTMDYFYQNDAATGPSSGRLYLQAGNSLRALKIYLPFLEIILLGLILYNFGGPLYLIAYLTYCAATATRFAVTSKLDGVRIWAGRYEIGFQATHKVYGFLLPLLSIGSLVFEYPVIAGLIGLFWCLAFYKTFRWIKPDLQFLRATTVRLYYLVLSILRRSFWFVFKGMSLLVNYSIYYCALLFGRDLKKERAAHLMAKRSSQPKEEIPQRKLVSASRQLPPIIDAPQEKRVHMLWIGPQIGLMEQLTLASFLDFGYDVHLWLYSETSRSNVPDAVKLMDANTVIPSEEVFYYRKGSQFGTGKGSVAGFSDIFRYKLLHDYGGWWVDMDVTCLKAFDVETPYFFRAHHSLPLVGNIMKAPKGSPIMWSCYLKAKEQVNAENRDWHLPIQILVDEVMNHDLQHCIYHGVSNTDEFDTIAKYFVRPAEFPVEWCAIHWCNEVLRSRKIDVAWMPKEGRFRQEIDRYNLSPLKYSTQGSDLASWEIKMIQVM